jgi:NADH-quinone oxidoreductase subunit C/D
MDNLRRQIVEKVGQERYIYKNNNHVVNLKAETLMDFIEFARHDIEFILLLDICGVDNLKRDSQEKLSNQRFELVYHFLNMETHQRMRIRLPVDETDFIPSIKKVYPNARWYEEEIRDLLGLRFNDSSYSNLLQMKGVKGYPYRKDFQEQENEKEQIDNYTDYTLKTFNPLEDIEQWIFQNPSIEGTAKFQFLIKDEHIARSKTEIGFHFRGLEKIFESKYFSQGIMLTESLNYSSSMMNNLTWCKAVEEHLNIDITDRAKGMRMIFAELSRVLDHLNSISNLARTLKVVPYEKYSSDIKERVVSILEKISGSRYNHRLNRIGGISCDLPPGWISECIDVIREVKSSVDYYSKYLVRSKDWMNLCRIGQISAIDSIRYGFTGPCLRAAGVNYDIRKSTPYYFYDQVDFDVIVGTSGDCYDRYLVRLEEIRQSLRIISQVLDNLPPGEVRVFSYVDELKSKSKDELARFCQDISVPIESEAGEIYSATEVANGEMGVYIAFNKSKFPYRVKLRTPGYCLLQSFDKIVEGLNIEQAKTVLASLNIVMSEIDR